MSFSFIHWTPPTSPIHLHHGTTGWDSAIHSIISPYGRQGGGTKVVTVLWHVTVKAHITNIKIADRSSQKQAESGVGGGLGTEGYKYGPISSFVGMLANFLSAIACYDWANGEERITSRQLGDTRGLSLRSVVRKRSNHSYTENNKNHMTPNSEHLLLTTNYSIDKRFGGRI